MPTSVTLRHVTKIYGEAEAITQLLHRETDNRQIKAHVQYALDDVNLTIRPGEVLAVLGPSGCGKTTLLRVVAGLETPTEGEVLYDGEKLSSIPMADRGIGMVFQNYALYPHLPSIDNIGFFLKLRKREIEIPQRVKEISEMMQIDLDPLLSRKPPTLSGGERQRVAVARCLARDPRVFLFDEPFSNLDAKLRTSMRVELKRLLQTYNVTSVYVTHDQTEAIALSDRIVILSHGRVMQIGSYQQLYNTPKNVFVAGFLGSPSMNLFRGYVRDHAWIGREFDWGPIRTDLEDGTWLILGVRPEHFQLDPAGAITARVRMIDRLYSDRVQLVHTFIGSLPATIKLPIEQPIKRTDELKLSIMPGQIHLFEENTGMRIG
jgi:multiple sugar transport system ATP-binding protein